MEEKKTQVEETSSDTKEEVTDGGQENTSPTFTQEDVNQLITKRLAEEKSRTEKAVQKRLAEERAEWEKQAKMSEEEKEKATIEKAKQENEATRRELTLQKNQILVYKRLGELGLPNNEEVVDMLVTDSEETTVQRVEAFHKTFTTELTKGIEAKLSNKAPVDPKQDLSQAKRGSLLL